MTAQQYNKSTIRNRQKKYFPVKKFSSNHIKMNQFSIRIKHYYNKRIRNKIMKGDYQNIEIMRTLNKIEDVNISQTILNNKAQIVCLGFQIDLLVSLCYHIVLQNFISFISQLFLNQIINIQIQFLYNIVNKTNIYMSLLQSNFQKFVDSYQLKFINNIQIMSFPERRLSLTQQKSLRESLQSIAIKFILNLPFEQRTQKLRLPFHYQKAYYYYIDHELKELFPKQDPKKVDFMWFVGQINKVLNQYMKIMSAEEIKKILGKHRPTCGAIIFNEKGNKVLVTESKNKFGFPKGAKDQDQSTEETAARQVKEEVGLFIHTIIDSNKKVQFLGRGQALVTFYIVTNFDQNQPIVLQNNEIDNAFWMNVSDVSKYLYKFSEKCKNAWREYQSSIEVRSNLSIDQFLNIYRDRSTRKDKNKEASVSTNPLLNFKLDHDRLFSVFKQITECQSP